jgi:GT2 family glycosyltransferase
MARGLRGHRSGDTEEVVAVPYLPYGGLLMSVDTVGAIGFPNTAFYLYEDDADYTNRVVRQGGRLLLARKIAIDDAEQSWSLRTPARGADSLLVSPSRVNKAYAARNRAYFDTHVYARSRTRLHVNRAIFLTLLLVRAAMLRRLADFRIIRRHLRDGEAGRLGVLPRDVA